MKALGWVKPLLIGDPLNHGKLLVQVYRAKISMASFGASTMKPTYVYANHVQLKVTSLHMTLSSAGCTFRAPRENVTSAASRHCKENLAIVSRSDKILKKFGNPS